MVKRHAKITNNTVRCWIGTSLQWRLMRRNTIKKSFMRFAFEKIPRLILSSSAAAVSVDVKAKFRIDTPKTGKLCSAALRLAIAIQRKIRIDCKIYFYSCLGAVDKTRNTEHSGISRNIPEHSGTCRNIEKKIMKMKKINNFNYNYKKGCCYNIIF